MWKCPHLHLTKFVARSGLFRASGVGYARVGAACSRERLAVTVLVKAAGRGGLCACRLLPAPLVCAFYARSAACRSAVQLRAEGARRGASAPTNCSAQRRARAPVCVSARAHVHSRAVVCAANAVARRQHDKIKSKSAYKKLMPRLTVPLYVNVELHVLPLESGTLSVVF